MERWTASADWAMRSDAHENNEASRRRRLADRVGVGRDTVNAWERGDSVPSLLHLGPLCAALMVDPRLFADLPEEPPSPVDQYLVDLSDVAAATALGVAQGSAQRPPQPARRRASEGSGGLSRATAVACAAKMSSRVAGGIGLLRTGRPGTGVSSHSVPPVRAIVAAPIRACNVCERNGNACSRGTPLGTSAHTPEEATPS